MQREGIGTRAGVQTVVDLRRVLATAIETVTADPDLDAIQRARVIAELARVALRAVQLGDLEARLAAIEAALQFRKDPPGTKKKKAHKENT